MNTMRDLKQLVHKEVLHLDGRLIDHPYSVSPHHMLGIVEMGGTAMPEDKIGTIFDKHHDFWDTYARADKINDNRDTQVEIEYALQLLQDDGALTIKEPGNDDMDKLYIEVEPLHESDNLNISVRDSGIGMRNLVVEYEDSVYETALTKK